MERRKAKISAVCISIIMILSVFMTVIGIYAFKNPMVNKNSYGAGLSANLNYNEDDYVGRIGDRTAYMNEQDYANLSNWEPITNQNNDLENFLIQEGKYQGKNGYLTEDVTLNWKNFTFDSRVRAALAPKRAGALNVQLDGCGYTITYVGDSEIVDTGSGLQGGRTDADYHNLPMQQCQVYNDITSGVLVGNDGSDIAGRNEAKEGYAKDSKDNDKVGYHAFGGMLNVLSKDGVLKNFKFKIDSTHAFYYIDRREDDGEGSINTVGKRQGWFKVQVAFGGLVGYNNGGSIDNVSVELASNKYLYASSFKGNKADHSTWSDHIFSERDTVAAIMQGLVVGVNDGGSITNVSSTMKQNSGMKIAAGSAWWTLDNVEYASTGATLLGGICGAMFGNGKMSNLYLNVESGAYLDVDLRKYTSNDQYKYTGYKIIGGIVASNVSGNISSAMVTGNMDFLRTWGDIEGEFNFGTAANGNLAVKRATVLKSIFVAEGTQPTNMIYKNANGGTTSDIANPHPDNEEASMQNSNSNTGYRPVSQMVRLQTRGYDNGNNQNEIKYYFSHDAYDVVGENNKVPVYDKAMIFVPEGKLLWDLYGKLVYDNLYKGATNEDIPYYYETPEAKIYVGNTGAGEIGFYTKVNANSSNASQDIYENSNKQGEFWQEMSDQNRARRAGVENSKLYYNGTTYQLKLKVDIGDGSGYKLYDQGLNIRNVGDLKNAKKLTGGAPVELYCEVKEGETEETTVAYANIDKRLLITLNDITGMDRTLEILKRDLIVTTTEGYTYGESTVFDNIQVSFGKSESDPANSGLVDGEAMLWQEITFNPDSNGVVTIDLNVAGHHMLRPSSNNYVLKSAVSDDVYNESTTFTAYILPHEITVEDGIYIRGTAVNGKFEIVNNRDFGDADKNNEKRKIRISARFNDGHFTADGIILTTASGNTYEFDSSNMTEYTQTARGLYYIEYTVTNNGDESNTSGVLKSIGWKNYKVQNYNVEINYADKTETITSEHRYGDKVALEATPTDSEVFVGWRFVEGSSNYTAFTNMDDNRQYLTYKQNDFFKIKGDIKLEAVYIARDESKYLQYYTDNYGAILRTRQADSDVPSRQYTLPQNMGWKFKEWQKIDNIQGVEGRVVFFRTVYEGNDDPATVQLIQDGEVSWEHFGRAITLKAGRKYLVNDSLVQVLDKDLTIYAINNMIITDVTDESTEDNDYPKTSLRHRSFQYGDTLYINLTFTYGGFGQSYITGSTEGMTEDEIRKANKPKIELFGFDENDFTEYVRQGNIYQLSIVITMQELECRFGNNTDIISTLTVNGEKFDSVLEILLKNKSFY